MTETQATKIQRHKIIPASYLVLIKDNKVLLQRRFNTGFEDGMYSFVAGHVDPNETFSIAIIRESKEEVGITLNPKDLNVVHVLHRKSTQGGEERIDIFFSANNWEGEITNMEPHKCDDLSWFDLDSLPENIISYIKEVLKNILKNKIYNEFGW